MLMKFKGTIKETHAPKENGNFIEYPFVFKIGLDRNGKDDLIYATSSKDYEKMISKLDKNSLVDVSCWVTSREWQPANGPVKYFTNIRVLDITPISSVESYEKDTAEVFPPF